VEQVEANAAAAGIDLTDDVARRIDEALAAVWTTE
jgi:aryl-alcohol dehydrogenase-like predicted oxidoreductase